MGDRRYFVVSAAVGVCAVLALAGPAWAQQCTQPNVRASTVWAPPPHVPEFVRQMGVTGDVTLDVTLDELSHVTSVLVETSPSKVLNASALEAARNSVFQTEVRQCRPIAGTYRFVVYFDPGPPEPSAVFGGTTDAPTLIVVERGSASRAPDMVTIRFLLSSAGADADAATAKDRIAYADFVKTLHAIGITDGALTERTINGLYPASSNYLITRFLQIRAKPRIETLQVLQAAAAAGASSASVQYAVSDDDGLFREALADAERSAARRARSSAATASHLLGDRTSVVPAAFRTRAIGPAHTVRLVRDAIPDVPEPPAAFEAWAALTASYALRP